MEKLFYGNQSSNQTIVLIIGVHPQEDGIHTAIVNALTGKSADLTKRYVLYYVHVTQDADNYSKGRMNGQLLAQEFIVPDVSSENPVLVVDNHENHGENSGYDYYKFLYPISNTTITTTYANEIISQMPFLAIYHPPNPTSLQYVTIPIADQGITTIIYETYFYDSETQKESDANALIDTLDILDTSTDPTTPTVTVNQVGGSFNNSINVTLTLTDPSSAATIYYTTDNSDPRTGGTQYTSPIDISTTTTLNFAAIDAQGNWSPIYTETYIIDTTAPTVNVEPSSGLFNTSQKIILKVNDDQDANPTIYYTTDGSDPKTSSTRKQYTSPISIGSTATLKFYAVDGMGNKSPVYTQKYTIDKTLPTAGVNIKSGSYNTNKTVKLSMSEVGIIYYTKNGVNPTTASIKYTGPITITSTTTLKFIAVDKAGNRSPVYTQTYTIDKTAPKITSTYPKNYATSFSRTATISIKFSEKIKSSINWSKVYIKNLSTGKKVAISKRINSNTLYLKMNLKRYAYNWYQVYIPASAIKDNAGNNFPKTYTFRFKTGRY